MTAWTDFVSQDFFRDPAAEIEKLKARGPANPGTNTSKPSPSAQTTGMLYSPCPGRMTTFFFSVVWAAIALAARAQQKMRAIVLRMILLIRVRSAAVPALPERRCFFL